MIEKKNPKALLKTLPRALIVEEVKESIQLVKDCLVKSGWNVVSVDSARNALSILEKAKPSLFTLIISEVKMPDMDDDEFLKKAWNISPFSQRMVIIPVEEKDILIRAINTANIHSCLSWPFKKEDLLSEADDCLKAFKHTIKRERFKRVIKRQNIQLYETAQQFNKKYVKNKQSISEKKAAW